MRRALAARIDALLPRRSRRRRLAAVGGVAGVLLVALVAVANAIVLIGGSSGDERIADAPHAQVALLLGAKVNADGSPSAMLRDRIAVAARLWHDGKVGKVLASGDHSTVSYDEVNAMKRGLLAAGVPVQDIFTDHAGFDTWASVVRARKVFEVSSALIVTQDFHLPRAVWLARQAGLTVHGVSADLHGYGRQEQLSQIREVLARVKAVADVATGAQPQFLGPAIPISGDARASAG